MLSACHWLIRKVLNANTVNLSALIRKYNSEEHMQCLSLCGGGGSGRLVAVLVTLWGGGAG